MRRFSLILAAIAACAAIRPAAAEIVGATPESLKVAGSVTIHAPSSEAMAAIGRIGSWWNPEHSYSGAGRNLSIDLTAGGCFCEKWAGGSVEHGRVIAVMAGKLVRIQGALGPLQQLGVQGILDLAAREENGATTITLTYIVNGMPGSGLDKIAPAVDGVLMNNLQRLGRLIENGAP